MNKTIHAKRVNVHPTSGMQRWKISKKDAPIILDWLDHDVSKIRKYRVHKDGGFGFSTGCGYAIFSADLLGGDGDGTAERRFEDETGYTISGK